VTALLEALFNGLSYSAILILVALGLAVTFGVMGVINMAHGEMLMLGGYTGYVLTNPSGLPRMVRGLGKLLTELVKMVGLKTEFNWHTDAQLQLSLYVALPIAFVVVGLVGLAMERVLVRHLYGRPLDTLLATWGVGLMLQQIVRLVFEEDVKNVTMPAELSGQWTIGGATFTHYYFFVILLTLVSIAVVYFGFFRTRTGLKIRAVTQNRPTASALGISTRQVDALAFAFGTGLAGVAGCIIGTYKIMPDMGTDYIVEAFIVVILGGMGQLLGVVPGGLVVGVSKGVAEKLYLNALIPGLFPQSISERFSAIAKVTVLVVVIAFITVRPSGLLRSKVRVYD
jgi:urea transport system permease protein